MKNLSYKTQLQSFLKFLNQSVPQRARYTCKACGDEFVILADFGRGVEIIFTEFVPDTCPDCEQKESENIAHIGVSVDG